MIRFPGYQLVGQRAGDQKPNWRKAAGADVAEVEVGESATDQPISIRSPSYHQEHSYQRHKTTDNMHWLLDTRPWLAASRHPSIIPLTTASTTSSSRLRKAPLVRNNISQNLLNPRSPPRNLANATNFPKSSAESWRIQHPMLEGAHICEPLRHDKVRKERDADGRRRPPLG